MIKHPQILTHLGLPFAVIALLLAAALPGGAFVQAAQTTPPPQSVTIAGTIQSKVGCSADWKPDCDKTFLTYDKVSDVWTGAWELPAGDYQYKAALNGSWTENYGAKAKSSGDNIAFTLKDKATVHFYYDHKTHWVTSDANAPIVTLVGTFESKLGCPADNKPDCLRTWLEDPAEVGKYALVTTAIPAGDYEARVALNQSADQIYGADGTKDSAPIKFTVAHDKDEIFFVYNAAKHQLEVHSEGAPHGDLTKALAQWASKDTIAWKVGPYAKGISFALHYDPNGAMKLTAKGVEGGQQIPLTYGFGGLNTKIVLKSPQLNGYTSLKIGTADLAKIPDILKGQLIVSESNADGKLLDATAVQTWGALDDLDGTGAATATLGVSYKGDAPMLAVWAPTAQSVTLHLFDASKTGTDKTMPMTVDATTGVWSVTGDASWTNKFYLYEVKVYSRVTGKVEDNLVTDPYSISLSTNSARSQIINFADPALMPDGWTTVKKPRLESPTDIVVYELHVRDFSIIDQTVPEADRGKYLAFTIPDSNGMKHLKALAAAGLTHIHLMPVFDITSINEDAAQRTEPDATKLAGFAADSDQQQALIAPIRDKDGFNWGYDPYHYTTPEGSYATNPDGSTRVLEFRKMVEALNGAGLRVVMDVVYNHTSDSGQNPNSVLDKIVPGYYYRLNAEGAVETSTCCQNTATEHVMMEKLMIDSLVTWATAYKVDGFRFDLMGHHMLSNMVKARDTLAALTMDKDGMDGSKIYLYGEGWDFGEVALNARGTNATQANVAGTGIGTFNDRLRDAARGGSPFDDLRAQGFVTGLFTDPSAFDQGKADAQKAKLLHDEDLIKLGMAGNLKTYSFIDAAGKTITGAGLDYNGQGAGYTLLPQENIVYDSAHDNQALFDAIQMKAPADADIKARMRMMNLGVDIPLLSQGVPFFLAGDDMLRSKSLDGNSYNAGDWFNKLDFTYQSDNFGVGLPPASDNQANWPLMKPLLANPALKPSPADIQFAVAHFQEMLRIRKSSPLFRLTTAKDVQDRVKFYNTGADQIPGVIIMSLTDEAGSLDPNFAQIVAIVNATPKDQAFTNADFAGKAFMLHPVQADSVDPVLKGAKFDVATGTFTVPARTTAVFVIVRYAP